MLLTDQHRMKHAVNAINPECSKPLTPVSPLSRQMLLDDQLMKVQAMNASPFVKAFKAETVAWEHTLVSLQVREGGGYEMRCPCRWRRGHQRGCERGCRGVRVGGGLSFPNLHPPPPLTGSAGCMGGLSGHMDVFGAHFQQPRHREANARGGQQVRTGVCVGGGVGGGGGGEEGCW